MSGIIVTHQRVLKCENDIAELQETIKKLTETIMQLQEQVAKKKGKQNESIQTNTTRTV